MPPGNVTEIEPAERQPARRLVRRRRAARVERGGDAASRQALRGQLLSFVDDPSVVGAAASHRHLEDGLLVIEDGRIAAAGAAQELLPTPAAPARRSSTGRTA